MFLQKIIDFRSELATAIHVLKMLKKVTIFLIIFRIKYLDFGHESLYLHSFKNSDSESPTIQFG